MSRAGAALVLLLAAGGCPEGYRFALVPGEEPTVNAGLETHIKELVAGQPADESVALRIHCAQQPALCMRDPVHGTEVDATTCQGLEPVFGFVHLSDAQLKEERVHMMGILSERFYDRVNGGAHRNELLEKRDYAGLLAVVLGINQHRRAAAQARASAGPKPQWDCRAPLPPALAIHTGDSVDSGMFSELFEFLLVMHRLEIPLFNVVGNHDMLFYGTLPADQVKGLDVVSPFVPIMTIERFLRAHRTGYAEEDMSIPLLRESQAQDAVAPEGPVGALPASAYHGFDLACLDAGGKFVDTRRLCNDADGYYAFSSAFLRPDGDVVPVPVRFIMLNTFEITPATYGDGLSVRSRGRMREEQYLWLADELRRASDEGAVIFVAGHHPIASFKDDHGRRLERLLAAHPRVVAYLAGHTHWNDIRVHPRPTGGRFWEIVGGSTLVHPQLGLFVDLLAERGRPDGYYLRVRSFRQQLGGGEGCRSRLACLAAESRRGAFEDRAGDGDWRDEADAVRAANALLKVSVGMEEVSHGVGRGH